MKEVKNNRVTVRLTDEEMRMLEQMSFEMDLSPSEIIRKTIKNYYQYYKMCY